MVMMMMVVVVVMVVILGVELVTELFRVAELPPYNRLQALE